MIFGIDISKYQGIVRFDVLTKYAPWVQFIAVEWSDGVDFPNPLLEQQWTGARSTGLPLIAYQYGRPFHNSGAIDAAAFLEQRSDRDGTIPCLDLEQDLTTGGREDLLAYVLDWGWSVMVGWTPGGTTKPPLLYSRLEYLQRHKCYEQQALANWGAWLADYQTFEYPTLPDKPVAIWQYGQGQVPGVAGMVDFDVFDGTQDQLRRYAP